jgi:hypothetical protein
MQVIEKDTGTDIQTGKPIKLLGPNIETDDYDEFLDELMESGEEQGLSFGTVQSCIHIGISYNSMPQKNGEEAKRAAFFAYTQSIRTGSNELLSIREDLSQKIEPKFFIKGWNTFNWNLYGMAGNPFPLWKIERKHITSLVSKKCRYFLYWIFLD